MSTENTRENIKFLLLFLKFYRNGNRSGRFDMRFFRNRKKVHFSPSEGDGKSARMFLLFIRPGRREALAE